MRMTSIQAKRLGTIVSSARHRKGLSIRTLASQLGVARGWLGELEAGRFLDPAPDRLARLAEALDIEPARIDRITRGAMADSLPKLRTYFRTKYELSPEQVNQVERYVRRLRSKP